MTRSIWMQVKLLLLASLSVMFPAGASGHAAEWVLPMAGNTFRTAPAPGGNGAQRNGTVAWSQPDEVYSVYFHVDRPAVLRLASTARSPQRARWRRFP